MAESPRPWRETRAGLAVTVRLTPRGGRDRIEGLAEIDGRPVLRARVAAPPVNGAANAALEALLAKALGVPRSAVNMGSGAGSRLKTIGVEGEAQALAARLEALVAGEDGRSRDRTDP